MAEKARGKQAPKLVIDWSKILDLTTSGRVKKLAAFIERSLKEGTAKLVYSKSSKADPATKPPPILLSVPVVQATWHGRTAAVEYLVATYSDIVLKETETSRFPDFKDLICCRDLVGRTPSIIRRHRHGPHVASHVAASLGNKEILHLWGKSCVEWRDDLGRTPLHWAALNCQKKTVKYLISLGAPVNAANDLGVTPLADCMGSLNKVAPGDIEAVVDIIFLLLVGGANFSQTHLAVFYANTVVAVLDTLGEDIVDRLLQWTLHAREEVSMSVGKLFSLFCTHAARSAKSHAGEKSSFCDYLLFLTFFCRDLAQVSSLWDRALQFKEDNGIKVAYLPPIPAYGDRTEVSTLAAAKSVISQAQLTSDLTEVVYQCAIMLERVLGSHSPLFIELLWDSPVSLGLEQAHPSKAVASMCLRAAELFGKYFSASSLKKYTFSFRSPVGYFDSLKEKKLDPDFVSALRNVLSIIEAAYKVDLSKVASDMWSEKLRNIQDCSAFFVFLGLELLYRATYLAITEHEMGKFGELPHDIDMLGLQLMKMSPPLASYYLLRYRVPPSWLKDAEEKMIYCDCLTQCYQSWVVRAGSLYTLDMDGKIAAGSVIIAVIRDNISIQEPLLDFLMEHAFHHDAVNSLDLTPHDTFVTNRKYVVVSGTKNLSSKQAVSTAVLNPPAVSPLACLSARAIIKYKLAYGAAKYLPVHIVKFILMHDRSRECNPLISHHPDNFEDCEDTTAELKTTFHTP